MSDLFSREPAMTIAVVQALLILAVSFGLSLSADQTADSLAASAAILGWVTRSKVSPA